MTLVTVFVRVGGAFLFIFCTQLGEVWPGDLRPLWLLIKFIQLEVVRPGLDSSQAAPVCTDSGKTGDPLPPSMKNQESFHWALRSTISDSHEMNWILFLCRVCVCVCVGGWGEVRCKDTEAGTVKSTHDEFTWAKRFSGYLIYSLEDWCWSWNSNTSATWCEELTHWKRCWCWERLKAGEGATKDEMIGWHHQVNGQEFEQAPWDGEG